jgi:drug/metabolite transporter (DMT)-like permease
MKTLLLFVVTTVLWGSSAIVTASQAAVAAPEISVALRMLIVSLCMLVVAVGTGKPLVVARADWGWVALQGVFFFGMAFIAFYHATQYMPSGVAALVLSSSSIFAALVGRFLLRSRLRGRAVFGIACGLVGLGIVTAPQILSMHVGAHTWTGLAWALLAAASTGGGTAITARNRSKGIPMAVLMSWSALFGAAFALAWCLGAGIPMTVVITPAYLAGLAYLAVIASCLTFAMYFTLVDKVGPARAANVLAMVPVVAMSLSVIFEGLSFNMPLLVGGTTILASNILVLRT